MTASSYSTDLSTILIEFPNTTGWSALGGGASGLNAPETDYFIQGNNCITKNAWASATKGMIYDNGSGITVPTDGAVIMFLAHATMNSVAAQASGGIQLLIGSSSSDFDQYYVGGSDTEVFGLWNPYPVNPTVSADATTGTPSATLQYFGGQANLPSGGPSKGSPWAIDAMRYGRCRIDAIDGDGTSGYATLALAEATANSSSNRWGLLENIKGVFFFQGFLSMGTASTAVDWRDSNRVINIRDTIRVTSGFNRFEIINASSNVEWTNYQLRALGTTSRGTFVVTAGTFTAVDCQFTDMGTFTFLASSSVTGAVFRGCDQITAPGTTLNGSKISGYTGAADTSAIVWNVATDPDGKMDNTEHTKGSAAHHAVELGTSSPTTVTFRGLVSSGYNAANGQNDSFFYVKRTSGSVTINVVGGTGNFSYKTDGATVSVVLDPVTTLVTVKDENDAPLQNAIVLVEAGDNTADLPFEESVSITRSGTTASVSHTAHGLSNGDKVVIRGVTESDYRGVFQIFNVTANAYDFTVGGTPGSDTGNSTGVVVSGLTNASGQVSGSRTFSVDQPVRYRIRMATNSPLYKPAPTSGFLTDTVDNADGLAISVKMIRDD